MLLIKAVHQPESYVRSGPWLVSKLEVVAVDEQHLLVAVVTADLARFHDTAVVS